VDGGARHDDDVWRARAHRRAEHGGGVVGVGDAVRRTGAGGIDDGVLEGAAGELCRQPRGAPDGPAVAERAGEAGGQRAVVADEQPTRRVRASALGPLPGRHRSRCRRARRRLRNLCALCGGTVLPPA